MASDEEVGAVNGGVAAPAKKNIILTRINPQIESGSSIRRRHSSRYVVHQDYLGGCIRLFDSPLKSLGGKILNCPEETLDEPSYPVSVYCKQGMKNSVQTLSTENKLDKCNSGGSKLKRKIISCEEALLS